MEKQVNMRKIETDFMLANMKSAIHDNGDCHHNSVNICKELKALDYDVSLQSGFFMRGDRNIRHTWILFDNKIFETDPLQLGIKTKNRFFCMIESNNPIIKQYKIMG